MTPGLELGALFAGNSEPPDGATGSKVWVGLAPFYLDEDEEHES